MVSIMKKQRVGIEQRRQPLTTSEQRLLDVLQQAGAAGVSFRSLVELHGGNEQSLRTILSRLAGKLKRAPVPELNRLRIYNVGSHGRSVYVVERVSTTRPSLPRLAQFA
jgi:hypothetical protein